MVELGKVSFHNKGSSQGYHSKVIPCVTWTMQTLPKYGCLYPLNALFRPRTFQRKQIHTSAEPITLIAGN